jgi:hypothetical protein
MTPQDDLAKDKDRHAVPDCRRFLTDKCQDGASADEFIRITSEAHMEDNSDITRAPDAHAKQPDKGSPIRFMLGVALMPLGVAAIVGGAILHFAIQAEKVNLFRHAGRFVILLGFVAAILGIVLAGSRAAVRFGIVTLVAGAGMFVYGYANLAEPSLRFYAPLGFFIGLGGGALIWAGRAYDQEMRKETGRKELENRQSRE